MTSFSHYPTTFWGYSKSVENVMQLKYGGNLMCFVLYLTKDVIKEGLTSLNVSIIKFYDFHLFHYIHWNKACNAFQWTQNNYTSRKSNVKCFKPQFLLFRSLKYYKILQKYSFFIGHSDVLNKLETIVYSLCFMKQTLELLLHLSFKAEVPTDGLWDISFLVLKSIKTWKSCCQAIGPSLVI